ncbi:hypothetical protein [Vibrio parahaemolyticus]|uniref:hypothetical protein n=1 Tax=Vibrio parahaemolyticus TaxID=670 RepID=UPI00235F8895|nr:hypothetical protein [Vibrio parahaemolyticus]
MAKSSSTMSLFYKDYKANIKRCLDFLTSNPTLKRHISQVTISRLKSYSMQFGASSAVSIHDLSIVPFELDTKRLISSNLISGQNISFGGELRFDDRGFFYQSLSLCFVAKAKCAIPEGNGYSIGKLDTEASHVIRRFHFDIDAQQVGNDRPVFHFQYGGNIHDDQKKSHRYELISCIDLPRIPSLPLDLVQALNLIFHQIDTDVSSVFKQSRWRAIVLENDRIWEKVYFESMRNRGNTTLYERLCSPNIFV